MREKNKAIARSLAWLAGEWRKKVLVILAAVMLVSGSSASEALAATEQQKEAAVMAADSVIAARKAAVTASSAKGKKAKKKLVRAQKKSLKKLFSYTKKFSFAREDMVTPEERVAGDPEWYFPYAARLLGRKTGSCYHFAAAFAILAKRATGLPVRICTGKANVFSKVKQAHGWVEIKLDGKWYVFDPNAARYSKKKMSWSFVPAKKAKKTYKATAKYYVDLG